MDQQTYHYLTLAAPQHVILDLAWAVRRLRLLFGEHEYLMSCILEDVADRVQYARNINLRTKEVARYLLEKDTSQALHAPGRPTWDTRRVQLFDRMVDFEQTALSIQQEVERLNLYVIGARYAPYRYETTLSDDAVVLSLISSWTDFLDTHPPVVDL